MALTDMEALSIPAAGFAGRLLRLYPRGWLSDAAQQPGGVAYATMLGIGTPLASQLSQVQFIALGTRIKTAVGTALDTISLDYFGPNGLPRNPAESDSSFRARILAQVLASRATRPAIASAIFRATGATPRMSEPWNLGDTGAYDVNSYFDIDGPENVAPARYGDWLPYTGFIDVSSPVNQASGGFPIWAIDIGASYDVPNSAYDLAGPPGTISAQAAFIQEVMNVVQAYKAFGITVGVRFSASGALAASLVSTLASSSGSALLAMSNSALTFVLQSWMQAFGVWLEVLPWQASAYLSTRGVSFEFTASADASAANTIGWYASLFSSSSLTAMRVPVSAGQSSLTLNLAIPSGSVPLITADWNTIPYVTSLNAAQCAISLSEAGSGNLDVAFVQGSQTAVPSSATSLTVTATLPAGYGLFATPSWGTTMSVSKSSGSFTLTFGTAAPSGASVYWAAIVV